MATLSVGCFCLSSKEITKYCMKKSPEMQKAYKGDFLLLKQVEYLHLLVQEWKCSGFM